MRSTLFSALLILPLLGGCSGDSSGDSKLSQTRMNDIDSLEGTINDDIINTDQSNEESPTEAAAPSPATAKKEGAKPTSTIKQEAKPVTKPADKPAAPAEVKPAQTGATE
jgi:hypothetical protein